MAIQHSNDGFIRVLSISYGKDSLACLGAIERLNLSLDRIIHSEVWATDDIPAEIPPMIEFKKRADDIINQRYGFTVEHFYDIRDGSKNTFDKWFYRENTKGNHVGVIHGFPMIGRCAVQSELKMGGVRQAMKSFTSDKIIQYIGYTIDEVKRLGRLNDKRISPLVLAGMTQEDTYTWCEQNDLLSPLYKMGWYRDGCFFCPSQNKNSLYLLRKNFPELWGLLLRWDNDCPSHAKFKPSGKTVHDYEKYFEEL